MKFTCEDLIFHAKSCEFVLPRVTTAKLEKYYYQQGPCVFLRKKKRSMCHV